MAFVSSPLLRAASLTTCAGLRRRIHSRRPNWSISPVRRRAQVIAATDPPKADTTDTSELEASNTSETTLEQEEGALDLSGDAVVVEPDQRLAAAFTFLGGFFVYNGTSWTVVGLPLVALGAFLYLQTARIRFVFGPKKLNVASRNLSSGELKFIRGWAYEEFAAWDIYPSPSFPILAYFRERESYGGRGSIHFFPILADGQQLRNLLETRTGRERG